MKEKSEVLLDHKMQFMEQNADESTALLKP